VVGGGFALDRAVGVRPNAAPAAAPVPSGLWICPHGGGEGWRATLYLANPGDEPVAARVTTLDRRGAGAPRDVEVPAGATVAVEVPAATTEAASSVEHFGGWLAVGWVTLSGSEDEPTAGAEPCAEGGGRAWYLADGSADEGQSTDVVITNPFGVDAVVDLVLLAKDRPPIRDTSLSSVVVRAGRSRSIRLGPFVAGERSIATIVSARVGRVAAATTVRVRGAGVRQLLGRPSVAEELILPLIGGTGQSELEVVRAGDTPTPFDATLLSTRAPGPAGDLVDQVVEATSAVTFPIISEGPAAVHVAAQGEAALAAGLRVAGPHEAGAVGWAAPGPRWVVTPTVAGSPATPGVVIVNPGDEAATVELRVLGPPGFGAEATLSVPGASVVGAPPDLLGDGTGAVLVIADRPVVAAGGSTSLGKLGSAAYALAMGVPVP
jgi:hypothetical protein